MIKMDFFFSFKKFCISSSSTLSHSLLAEGLNVKIAVTVGHPGLKFGFSKTALQCVPGGSEGK